MFGLFKKKKSKHSGFDDPDQCGMNYFVNVEKPSPELNLIAKIIMHQLDVKGTKYTIDRLNDDHLLIAEQSLLIQKIASIAQFWSVAFLKQPLFKEEIHFGFAGFLIGSFSKHYIDFESNETVDIFTPQQEELILFIVDKYTDKKIEQIMLEEINMSVFQDYVADNIGEYSPEGMKDHFNRTIPEEVSLSKASGDILYEAEKIRRKFEEQ